MPGPCFAQNEVFADCCPVFYVPGIPQAELSCSFPNRSFSLAVFSFESGGGGNHVVVYLLHIHLITVAMILLPSARQEKNPPPKKKSLTVKMYFFMSYSLRQYSSGAVRCMVCFIGLSKVSDVSSCFQCLSVQASVLSTDQFWVCASKAEVFESCPCFHSPKSVKI